MFELMERDQVLVTRHGLVLIVIDLIKGGGHGFIAKARCKKTGKLCAVKQLYPELDTRENRKRFEFLCSLNLRSLCPLLVGPIDIIEFNGTFGYYTDFIDGKELRIFLETEKLSWMRLLILAIEVVIAIAHLHARNITHGDIRQANILILKSGNLVIPYWIDFDNFSAPGLPTPPSVGDEYYMAPELYKAYIRNKVRYPDIYSENFALGILMEEILLLNHPTKGFPDSPKLLSWALHEGVWRHDPTGPFVPRTLKGYSPRLLNERMISLFRSVFSLVPTARATSFRWKDDLIRASHEVDYCSSCGYPSLVDSFKTACHNCGKTYPILHLVLPNGRRLLLESAYRPVGRGDIGGSQSVSRCHAVFRRKGPFVAVESQGENGTFLKQGQGWIKLDKGIPVMLSSGDVLRMADSAEMRIE